MQKPNYVSVLNGINIHNLGNLQSDWKEYKDGKITLEDFEEVCRTEHELSENKIAAVVELFNAEGILIIGEPDDNKEIPLDMKYAYAGTIDRCSYLVLMKYDIKFDTSY